MPYSALNVWSRSPFYILRLLHWFGYLKYPLFRSILVLLASLYKWKHAHHATIINCCFGFFNEGYTIRKNFYLNIFGRWGIYHQKKLYLKIHHGFKKRQYTSQGKSQLKHVTWIKPILKMHTPRKLYTQREDW